MKRFTKALDGCCGKCRRRLGEYRPQRPGPRKLELESLEAAAEATAAIFSLITSCPHPVDPEQYLEEVRRVLPHWPDSRYLELAPNG